MALDDYSPVNRTVEARPDAFHQALLRAMMESTSAIFWGRNGETFNSGSMFFVDTGKALLAVTARHVYQGYLAALGEAIINCNIDNLTFDPRERLISAGAETDIATFRITREELDFLQKGTIPWPPVMPEEGESILLSGLPGVARSNPSPYRVAFGSYTGMFDVKNVSARSISTVKPPNGEMVDIIGKGLPPSELDIGGMSGGPMTCVRMTPNGLVTWSVSAVIYEGHQSFDIIKGVRADLIAEDGTVLDWP